jgi:hypothetical protein
MGLISYQDGNTSMRHIARELFGHLFKHVL